ncbi:hypothetical protein CHS0354_019743 [Potamilus streckersoni]|uniref:Uncharacterized protein n=1 Tax=Potamilus streckersoni TaxID=2493646 RepID=A0AAE0VRU9_9BIVA|nr:hypothetical protein CHS0354_019743 [Potamilus streckersoni]
MDKQLVSARLCVQIDRLVDQTVDKQLVSARLCVQIDRLVDQTVDKQLVSARLCVQIDRLYQPDCVRNSTLDITNINKPGTVTLECDHPCSSKHGAISSSLFVESSRPDSG